MFTSFKRIILVVISANCNFFGSTRILCRGSTHWYRQIDTDRMLACCIPSPLLHSQLNLNNGDWSTGCLGEPNRDGIIFQ